MVLERRCPVFQQTFVARAHRCELRGRYRREPSGLLPLMQKDVHHRLTEDAGQDTREPEPSRNATMLRRPYVSDALRPVELADLPRTSRQSKRQRALALVMHGDE